MKGVRIVKLSIGVLIVLALGACAVIGGPIQDGPEIELRVSALWNGTTPPEGSTAMVDFYVMEQGTGAWTPVELAVPYPIATPAGVLVDTFRYESEVPTTGERVTYRYEIALTVGGETYSPADYPALACESAVWWWYFAGSVVCSERER